MSAPFHDPELDAQLRDLPVPDGMLERLKGAIAPSDDQLDARLRRVVVPRSVLLRLHEVPADLAVDEALVAAPHSPALVYALRKPTVGLRLRRVGRQMARLAQAAVWFIAINLVLAAGGGALLTSIYPQPEDPGLFVIYQGPLSVEAEQTTETDVFIALSAEEGTPLAYDETPENSAFDQPITRIGEPDIVDPSSAGPVAQFVSLVNSGFRPMDDAVLLRWGVLGSPHYADDDLPGLTAPSAPRAAGIEPPLSRGYDRPFFLRHRIFPPIAPAADPKLARLEVPLIAAGGALARLEQSIAQGRTPPPEEVRVESLIASMDLGLPQAPAGKLALRTAAGPSPFASNDAGLLLVGVRAGGFLRRPLSATHLVLAIDLSYSMARDGHAATLQTAIDRLLPQLGPRDRLSLVVFNDQVVQVVEGASAADADSIRALLRELSPRGGTNLAAGLQQAVSLAMADVAGPAAARRLLLITDSRANFYAETAAAIDELLIAADQMEVRLDVLDLSGRAEEDALYARWAQRQGGELRQVHDARQLAWSLLGALSGREAAIARDARLTLHFNPKTVAAYRLVGHEANALADVAPAALEAEFAPGETAAALVEVWFLPGDGDDLGHAELSWNDPETGQEHRQRQRISRLQFAPTLAESPLPLVKAALAAEVGEALRGSQEALRLAGVRPANHRGLSAVLQTSREAGPRVERQADVQRLIDVSRSLQRQGLK